MKVIITYRNMLKMGSSKPWPDAMEVLTGQREMKADGLLEYFRPLHEWLKAENQRTGEFIGWESSRTRKYSFSFKCVWQRFFDPSKSNYFTHFSVNNE